MWDRKHKIKHVSWPNWEIPFSWENDIASVMAGSTPVRTKRVFKVK